MKYVLAVIVVSVMWISGNAQKKSPDGWIHISYLLDNSGNELAKRFEDSTWKIADPKKAIEAIYIENQQIRAKYLAALNILKLLSPTGTPIDQKKYWEAIIKFNSLK